MEPILTRACPNAACKDLGRLDAGNIILHASFVTKVGAKERCLCKTCGVTFSANTGTAYAGLSCSRSEGGCQLNYSRAKCDFSGSLIQVFSQTLTRAPGANVFFSHMA